MTAMMPAQPDSRHFTRMHPDSRHHAGSFQVGVLKALEILDPIHPVWTDTRTADTQIFTTALRNELLDSQP